MSDSKQIKFIDDETNEEIWFEVIDEVVLEGVKYILVAEEDEECIILKQTKEEGEEVGYSLLEDEDEFKRVATEFMTSEDYDIEV